MARVPVPSISLSSIIPGIVGFILGILFMLFLAAPLFTFFDSDAKCKEYVDSRGLSSYTNAVGEALQLTPNTCKYSEEQVGKYTAGKVDFSFSLGVQSGNYHYEWSPGLPGSTLEKITISSFQTTNKELFEVVRSNKCGYFSYLASLYHSTPDLQARYSAAASTCLGFDAAAEDADGSVTFSTLNGASYVFSFE